LLTFFYRAPGLGIFSAPARCREQKGGRGGGGGPPGEGIFGPIGLGFPNHDWFSDPGGRASVNPCTGKNGSPGAQAGGGGPAKTHQGGVGGCGGFFKFLYGGKLGNFFSPVGGETGGPGGGAGGGGRVTFPMGKKGGGGGPGAGTGPVVVLSRPHKGGRGAPRGAGGDCDPVGGGRPAPPALEKKKLLAVQRGPGTAGFRGAG